MIFSGFEISGMKNIKMPDDAKKNHLKKFEKTGRRGYHGLIKFGLRQKINQKRKKQMVRLFFSALFAPASSGCVG